MEKKRKKITYKGQEMASHKEVEFAKDLDSKNIPWMYESEYFMWMPPEPKLKRYTPDFVLHKKDGGKMYIEYKGYLRPEDKRKLRAMKKQHPDLDIRLVFQNAKKKLNKRAKSNYGEWATKLKFPWAESFIPEEWIEEVNIIERKNSKKTRKVCKVPSDTGGSSTG